MTAGFTTPKSWGEFSAAVARAVDLGLTLGAAQTQKLDTITPFDFSGVGGGVQDDSNAIEDALNHAFSGLGTGFLELPARKIFKVTRQLNVTMGLPHRYVPFGVRGNGSRIVSALNDNTRDIISITVTPGSGAQIRHMHFIGLMILGQGGATPKERDAISITCDQNGQAAYVFRFDRCVFESIGRHGVKLTGNIFEGGFDNSGFSGCGGNGINMANGSSGIISSIGVTNCNFRDCFGDGVNAGSIINDVYYSRCDFISNGGYGISQVNGIPLITGCHFENNHKLAAGAVDGQAAIACNNFITAIGCVAFASGAAAKQTNLLRTSVANNAQLIGCWAASSGGAPASTLVWLNNGGTAGRSVFLDNCLGTPTAQTPVVNMVVNGQHRPYALTVGRTLAPQENGGVVSNAGASGAVALTLPTQANTVPGQTYTAMVLAAQTFGFTANTGVTIRDAGDVSGSAGTLTAATIGNMVTVKAISTTQWIVVNKIGTWTLSA